jgi:hypothetical protein
MRAALLLALGLCAAPVSAEDVPLWLAGELSLTTGFDYSDGEFGDTHHTTTLFVPVTLAYLFDHFLPTAYGNDLFELKVTIPWVQAQGPGIVGVSSDGSLPNDRRQGLGDISVGASYLVFPPVRSPLPALELSTRIKIPTASNSDQKLLGTGGATYTLQLDLYRQFGRVTPLFAAGYRFADASTEFNVRNAAFTSVGASVRVSKSLSAGLLYDWYEQSAKSSDDRHELFPYLTVRLRDDLRVSPYAVIGPPGDWGSGIQLRYSIPLR